MMLSTIATRPCRQLRDTTITTTTSTNMLDIILWIFLFCAPVSAHQHTSFRTRIGCGSHCRRNAYIQLFPVPPRRNVVHRVRSFPSYAWVRTINLDNDNNYWWRNSNVVGGLIIPTYYKRNSMPPWWIILSFDYLHGGWLSYCCCYVKCLCGLRSNK